jgi:DNA end-binding protein Ku
MARPIWKGSISFGLVNVPVVLYGAENRRELHFRMLDGRNHAPVKYERKNEQTGEEVPWGDIVKGYEYADGQYVLLGDEDFKRAAVASTQMVDIQDFVDLSDVPYIYFDKPYYLVPGAKGEKGYVLLRETLRQTRKAGIAKVVIHTRQYLAALVVQDNALVLNLLRFHDELRDLSEFEFPTGTLESYRITPKELEMAGRLVDTMAARWDPTRYHDDYRDALMQWIDEKVERGETMPAPAARGRAAAEQPAGLINIMDLLKKSVEEKSKTGPARKPAAKPAGKTAPRSGGKRKRAS